uniref:Transmembrane protein n=1 Tax=Steinernema glaseri TaxID=37863 RepID=A0A1I8AIN9_9BILA
MRKLNSLIFQSAKGTRSARIIIFHVPNLSALEIGDRSRTGRGRPHHLSPETLTNPDINIARSVGALLHPFNSLDSLARHNAWPTPFIRKCTACPNRCSLMRIFYSLLVALLIPLAWTATGREDHIVPSNSAIYKSWTSSSNSDYNKVKITDQMIFGFKVDNTSSPFRLNLRVFNKTYCERIRICLPFENAQVYQVGKRYSLCGNDMMLDFNYAENKLMSTAGQMTLNGNFSDNDVITFLPNGNITLHGRKSASVISQGKSSTFFTILSKDQEFNFTILQDRHRCLAQLRDMDESAAQLVALYRILPIYMQAREGYNIWVALLGAICGSLCGGIVMIFIQMQCRYVLYYGYYKSFHTVYAFHPRTQGCAESPEAGGSRDGVKTEKSISEKP